MKGYKILTPEQKAEIFAIYAETKSTRLTAERTGWAFRRVASVVKRAGLPMTNRRGGACDRNREAIIRLVGEGLTLSGIARRIGTNKTRVREWLQREGIPYERFRPVGDKNPRWQGGKTIDKDGYVLVLIPAHPRADRHGRVREHRLVMEEKLGRLLDPSEVVHHKDGVKTNNHPDNLELFSSNADHLRETITGQVPNWTPEGKERIRTAAHQAARLRRESNRTASAPDAHE